LCRLGQSRAGSNVEVTDIGIATELENFMSCCSHCVSSWKIGVGFLVGALAIAAATGFGPQDKPAAKPAASSPPQAGKATAVANPNPYPLATCVVSGEKLGSMGKPVVKEYEGREVRFCCAGCIKDFEKNQATFMKKIDDKIIEQQLPHYPLKTCVVMEDEPITGEGSEDEKPVNLVYKNRLVRFCCSKCIRQFKAEPEKFLKKIDDAVIKEQKPKYPLETDVVTGAKLGPDAVDHVFGVTLVRFANKDSVAQFNVEPHTYIAKLHEAWDSKGVHGKEGEKKKGSPSSHDGHEH
jgi:YHS domain-containing protein